jgi:hypothetical protein
MFIPRFDHYASDDKDLLLCPCICLEEYIRRTKDLRLITENLLLQINQVFTERQPNLHFLDLIQLVYEGSPSLQLCNTRAHVTLRLSTSWALFNNASIQEIIQAAHWAFETTSTSFYLKDVGSEDSLARASLLETAHWRGKRGGNKQWVSG